jgi:hypothetical protein
MERADTILPVMEHLLKSYLPLLKDKFAKTFNTEKRNCWTKDMFGNNALHLPTHKDDLPEGFNPDKAINAQDLLRSV